MPRPRGYVVKYRADHDEWKVRLRGSTRASKTADNKKKAVRMGKRLANDNNTSLYVYTRDGRHQETQNYTATDRAKQR